MLTPISLAAPRGLEEFVKDPALTVACVLLIGVSIAWILVARAIAVNLRRAERSAGGTRAGKRGRRRRTPGT